MESSDEEKEDHVQEVYEEIDESQVVTVTDRLIYHKKRGKFLVNRAQEILVEGTHGKAANAIAAFLKHDDAASMFYRSHISYKASGRFREAADSLILCANMYEHQKMYLEAGTLFTEASELFAKVDKGECVKTLRKAISIYCDAGKFEISARMERKVADLHFESKHWEEAAFHYRKAANFLSGEQLLDQSDYCLSLASRCYEELKLYEKVRELEELIAYGCVQSNLRRFNARDHLFTAALTLYGEFVQYPTTDVTEKIWRVGMQDEIHVTPDDVIAKSSKEKYDAIMIQLRAYEEIDYQWRVCKEQKFLQNILTHRMNWDLHELVDHIYYWHNVRPLSRMHLQYLKVVVEEVTTEFARKKELRELEEMRKDLEKKRREKRKELYEQAKVLNLPLDSMIENMENMLVEDEERVQNAKTQATLMWEAHFTGEKKKDLKKRAAAEHEEAHAELHGEEEEKGEGGEGEGGGGGGGGEGAHDEDDEDGDFEDPFADDDDEEEKPKVEKKERRRRVKKK